MVRIQPILSPFLLFLLTVSQQTQGNQELKKQIENYYCSYKSGCCISSSVL